MNIHVDAARPASLQFRAHYARQHDAHCAVWRLVRHNEREAVRAEIEGALERLIEALDALDADAEDLEPEHDAGVDDIGGEASLGAAELVRCPGERFPRRGRVAVDASCDQSRWAQGGIGEPDVELDDSDAEPSLGAPETHTPQAVCEGGVWSYREADQRRWAQGSTRDGEEDAGEQPEREDEHGTDLDDGELDEAESGIGDNDGLAEQLMRHHGIIAGADHV